MLYKITTEKGDRYLFLRKEPLRSCTTDCGFRHLISARWELKWAWKSVVDWVDCQKHTLNLTVPEEFL